jgi:hypothetical protein
MNRFGIFILGMGMGVIFITALNAWLRRRREGSPAKTFNKEQEKCIIAASRSYLEMRRQIERYPKPPLRPSRLNACFAWLILAQFRGTSDIICGCLQGLSLYGTIQRLEELRDPLLLTALEGIIRCDDPATKSVLVYQYRDMLAAALFDSSDEAIRLDILCAALGAIQLSEEEQRQVKSNQHAYLQPLGFVRHEVGNDVVWSWPRGAKKAAA